MKKTFQGAKFFRVTSSQATLVKALRTTPTGKRIFVTDIAGSSDKKGAVLSVKEGAGTVIFQVQMSGNTTPVAFSHQFETPLVATSESRVWVEVDGINLCKANLVGFIV